MRVAIHQPHYLPWLRYFEKIHAADVFIVLDNIQYNKNGWQNRNKIKTAAGTATLTVPVHAALGENLDTLSISSPSGWRKKHWRGIEQNYRRAPHFERYAESIRSILEQEWTLLNDLNRHMLEYFVEALGIDTAVAYSSELDVPGTATARLVNLIEAVGGDSYYSGAYALEVYLDAELLHESRIDLELQSWQAPIYPQLYGDFVPDLSIVDLLMNCGPDSLQYIEHAGTRQD